MARAALASQVRRPRRTSDSSGPDLATNPRDQTIEAPVAARLGQVSWELADLCHLAPREHLRSAQRRRVRGRRIGELRTKVLIEVSAHPLA